MSDESPPGATVECDVGIIGAGLAGSALAYVLAATGCRVALIDVKPRYPHVFKAEKIEPHQATWLRELGLYDIIRSVAAPIHGVIAGWRGWAIDFIPIEQLGAAYHDMANAVRDALPESVFRVLGRVSGIESGRDRQLARFDDGRTVSCRLLIVACGIGGKLHAHLGIRRRVESDPHSVAFGFDIAPAGGGGFTWDAVSYYPHQLVERVDYLTLFAFPGAMRANLFAYVEPTSPFVKRMQADPAGELRRIFPHLEQLIGPFTVPTRVDAFPIDLWVAEEAGRDGLVLVADACQSVCPATGTGVSKILTDVRVLSELVPRWLATPGMGAAKVREYYADERKRASDAWSLQCAKNRMRLVTNRSLRMHIHRAKERVLMILRGRKRLRAMPAGIRLRTIP